MTRFCGSAASISDHVRPDVARTAGHENGRHAQATTAAADRRVRETQRAHLLDGVEVPTVDDHGTPERLLDAREIRMPVLVPVGDDDERVGTDERLVARRRELDAIAEAVLAFFHRDRIVRDDGRPGAEQLAR